MAYKSEYGIYYLSFTDLSAVKVKSEPGTSTSKSEVTPERKEGERGACAVCKTGLDNSGGSSRLLTRKQCVQFNMRDEDWREGMRVCGTCRYMCTFDLQFRFVVSFCTFVLYFRFIKTAFTVTRTCTFHVHVNVNV